MLQKLCQREAAYKQHYMITSSQILLFVNFQRLFFQKTKLNLKYYLRNLLLTFWQKPNHWKITSTRHFSSIWISMAKLGKHLMSFHPLQTVDEYYLPRGLHFIRSSLMSRYIVAGHPMKLIVLLHFTILTLQVGKLRMYWSNLADPTTLYYAKISVGSGPSRSFRFWQQSWTIHNIPTSGIKTCGCSALWQIFHNWTQAHNSPSIYVQAPKRDLWNSKKK